MLCIFTVCQCYRLSCVWNLQGLFWTINIQPWMKSRQLIKVVYKLILWNTFTVTINLGKKLSRNMKFPTMWYVWPAKAQTSLHIRAVWSELLLVASRLNILWELLKKIVCTVKKCHNHKPQTKPWHREEEPLNHHETPGRQIISKATSSLLHQDDCNTRKKAADWTSWFGVSKLKGRLHCARLSLHLSCQNATLFEIPCHSSYFDEADRCLVGVVMWSQISSHVISHRT